MGIQSFSLVDQKKHDLVKKYLEKNNNPYLVHANTKEELSISKLLNDLNPDISEKVLENFDYKTLVEHERITYKSNKSINNKLSKNCNNSGFG